MLKDQQGIVHILALLILLGGIIGGVYLTTNGNPLKLFSKATNPPIVFKSSTGAALPTNAEGVPQTTSATIKIELTSTLGPPTTSYPTPYYGTPAVQGVTTASYSTPTYYTPASVSNPITVGTVSYRIAENPTELAGKPAIPYTAHPTVIDYTFQDPSLGEKFIWVEFKSSTVEGNTDTRTAQINLIAPSASVSVSPSTITGGDTITVSWSGVTNPTVKDWITLYSKESGAGHLNYIYTSSCGLSRGTTAKASDSCSFTLPTPLIFNSYELRLLTNDSNTVIATSPTLTNTNPAVPTSPNPATITVNPTTARPGDSVKVTWSGVTTPTTTDWIALYSKTSGSRIGYIYARTCSSNQDGAVSATYASSYCNFTLPANLALGQYYFKLLAENTGVEIKKSAEIEVANFKRVFITSTNYNGNLGGLSGADAKCQAAANDPDKNTATNDGLGGIWKAWLSDSTTSPTSTSRMIHFDGPYKRLDGLTIADDWSELILNLPVTNQIQYPILKTELGGNGVYAWTNTKADGTIYSNSSYATTSCNDWSSSTNSSSLRGVIGSATATNSTWTQYLAIRCDLVKSLYCFEQ